LKTAAKPTPNGSFLQFNSTFFAILEENFEKST